MIINFDKWGYTEKESLLMCSTESGDFSMFSKLDHNLYLLIEVRENNWPGYYVDVRKWNKRDILDYAYRCCEGYHVNTNRIGVKALRPLDLVEPSKHWRKKHETSSN